MLILECFIAYIYFILPILRTFAYFTQPIEGFSDDFEMLYVVPVISFMKILVDKSDSPSCKSIPEIFFGKK